jgi:hypothetical protein
MDAPRVSDSWVHWLIESSLDPKKKKGWFLSKLNGWLNDLKKDNRIFKKQWHWLARLTSDLPDSKRLVKKYPAFHAVWCKALHELNQTTYKALLTQWRKKHNRRRNLWRDMKAIGLPV